MAPPTPYGDYNNDGLTDNPGDGYGLLPYRTKLGETLPLAANTSDATQHIKDRVAEVQVTLNNIDTWTPLLIARAEEILNADQLPAPHRRRSPNWSPLPHGSSAAPTSTTMARLNPSPMKAAPKLPT